MKQNYEVSTISAISWKLLDNFGTQLVSLVVQIILARILFPSDYAIVALTTIFITIANVFVHSGFTTSIIQKKIITDLQLSSIFFVSILTSIVLYLIIFIISPSIALFYGLDELTFVLRVQSLLIIFGGFSSVHSALLTRILDFSSIFMYRIFSLVVQGFLGVFLALNGYGVWALVISSLSGSLIINFSYWRIVKWRPLFMFSYFEIKSMFPYSARILFSSLANVFYANTVALLIGIFYTPKTLAFYNRGIQIPTLLMVNTDGAINAVIFPVLSKIQNDRNKVLEIYRKSLRLTCYIVFPMLIGLIVIAEPFTKLVLTEKWIESVPFMMLYSATIMTWPFSIRFQALNAIGRSDLSLKLGLIDKSIGLLVILLTFRYGIIQFLFSTLIVSILNVIIGGLIIKRIFGYNLKDQVLDVGDTLVLSVLMGLFLNFGKNFISSPFILLIATVLLGSFFYLFGSILIKHDSLFYILSHVNSTTKKLKYFRK